MRYYLEYLLVPVLVCLLPAIQKGDGWMLCAALLGYFYNSSRSAAVCELEHQGIDIEHLGDIIPDSKNYSGMSVSKKLDEYEDKNVGLDRSKPSPLDGAGIAMVLTFFPDGISDRTKSGLRVASSSTRVSE